MNVLEERLAANLEKSAIARAAREVGFSFGRVSVRDQPAMLSIRLEFTCVCGRPECLLLSFATEETKSWPGVLDIDLAERLWYFGSFDYKHLIGDGYAEEDACRISEHIREAVRVTGIGL